MLEAIAEHLIKPCIIFESKPEFTGNTKAVYDEMVRRGYERKYHLIWYIKDEKCAVIKNGIISVWDPKARTKIRDKIRNYMFYYRTKCIICENSFLTSSGPNRLTYGKDQVSFYLSHGTPIKSVKQYYTSPEGIDYCLSAAPELNKLMSDEFSIPLERVFAAGFPRTDVLLKPAKHLNQVLDTNYNKVIVWYPTYRQNTNKSINLSGSSLPLIHDEEKARQLNEMAMTNNTLIIIKPHFAQDISLIKKMELSNILFIDDDFFEEHNVTPYEFLAGSDALITDYSSVYFDYTLLDKPIAVIWEDIEEYKMFPGFAINLSDYLQGAEKIYEIKELCDFIVSVANGEDYLRKERREIRDRTNYSLDGRSSERTVDFIVEKASL